MKKICLVYGGDSLENEISILTALKIEKELDKYSYPHMLVYLDENGNFYTGTPLKRKENYQFRSHFIKGQFEKKNNKYYFKTRFKKEEFDMTLLLCHGQGSEDGTLGGFFDTLKIPCIYPGIVKSAIIQDKGYFKEIMKALNIDQVNYLRLNEKSFENMMQKNTLKIDLKYPLIIKPSHLGSSIGIKKVDNIDELLSAIYDTFKYDEEIIIEECLTKFKEVNIAIFRNHDLIISELERVNDQNSILTFLDKYDNYRPNDSHVIPADINPKFKKKIIAIAKKVYLNLNLKSVMRFDFLLDEENGKIYLNEVNAIPGSLAYYLFEPLKIKMIDLIQMMIEAYENEMQAQKNRVHDFDDDLLLQLKDK